MNLIIPAAYLREVNKYSGFFNPKSHYSKKALKGLFRGPENQEFLASKINSMITSPSFVTRTLAQPTEDYADSDGLGYRTGFGNGLALNKIGELIEHFRKSTDYVKKNILEMIEMHPLPYDEDVFTANPIMQLHNLNRDFLLKSATNIVQNPEMLVPRYFATNPETGDDESKIEWDYTSESYADGVWHPEHLFTNSQRNRENPYWEHLEVNFYSDPEAQGLGHRYYNKVAVGPSKRTGLYATTQRTRSQFPRWQDAGARAHYEYNTNEALREGGSSDRRVQRPHGYNMSSLVSKSTY